MKGYTQLTKYERSIVMATIRGAFMYPLATAVVHELIQDSLEREYKRREVNPAFTGWDLPF